MNRIRLWIARSLAWTALVCAGWLVSSCETSGEWHRELFSYVVPVGNATEISVSNPDGTTEIRGVPLLDSIWITGAKHTRISNEHDPNTALERIRVNISARSDVIHISPDLSNFDGEARVDLVIIAPNSMIGRLQSTNGNIKTTDVEEVVCRSVNGGINVRGTHRTELHTVNGPISIDAPRGTVSAESVNGPVNSRIASAIESISISTVNGPITIGMNANVNAELGASSRNGRVSASGAGIRVMSAPTPRQISGVVGQGGPPIRLKSVNGPIAVSVVGNHTSLEGK
jgi:DUF4097 and DUF4098 domain-containing protein YvlB